MLDDMKLSDVEEEEEEEMDDEMEHSAFVDNCIWYQISIHVH